jgi:hypothetical protein
MEMETRKDLPVKASAKLSNIDGLAGVAYITPVGLRMLRHLMEF